MWFRGACVRSVNCSSSVRPGWRWRKREREGGRKEGGRKEGGKEGGGGRKGEGGKGKRVSE